MGLSLELIQKHFDSNEELKIFNVEFKIICDELKVLEKKILKCHK